MSNQIQSGRDGFSRITLANQTIRVSVLTWGATICELSTPDRQGRWVNIVLGYDDDDGYLANLPYFGAIIGRYANRIANGTIILEGRQIILSKNDGANSLHGGATGFSHRAWSVGKRTASDCIHLTRVSEDGEEGYPGRILVEVLYRLLDEGLQIDYRAKSDATTVINLTNHSYFNLGGEGAGNILGHHLSIAADSFTPVAAGLIPTGEIRACKGGPFDFRELTPIGARIHQDDPQLELGGGYDHNWVLRSSKELRRAALLYDPGSGRSLEVLTTEPGLQVYTGNRLDGSLVGRGGKRYSRFAGVALETQHFPDSPHQPSFPTTLLTAGALHSSTTIWRFSASL